MPSSEKTVAIIGGGPGWPCRGCACSRPRSRAGRARGGRQGWPCRPAMVTRAHVLALGLQRRQGIGRLCCGRKAGTARNPSATRPAENSLRNTLSLSPAAPGSANTSRPMPALSQWGASGSTRSRRSAVNLPRLKSATRTARDPRRCAPTRVIDASGTWDTPNPAGVNGLQAIGEAANARRHRLWHARCARRTALPLCEQDRRGPWRRALGRRHHSRPRASSRRQSRQPRSSGFCAAIRRRSPLAAAPMTSLPRAANSARSLPSLSALAASGWKPASGSRTSPPAGDKLRLGAGSACCGRHVEADELIVATGFRPELSFLREFRTALDPALECPPILAPLIDPNLHSCGTVRPHGARELAQPEPGFYFAGMKSYGRAPTFLMMTGYEQVRSIIADIAGDHEAAERVELVLPETGVCSRPVTASAEIEGCCGGPAPVGADACCKQDADAKATGSKGCGCS